ncbi:MAG TPA: hypothetical protein VHN11_02610 [Xanthobacteraceae bacterium]|nr:hypothetical protein [Xanthobacteraceae bacterium]
MSDVTAFRSHATECLRQAEQAKALRHKVILLNIAQAWVLLEEQTKNLQSKTKEEHSQTSA